MTTDLSNIILKIKKIYPLIKEKYSVEEIEIFGSYVKGKNRSNSDLDVLIKFGKTPTLIKYIELENFLSEYLKIKVDLVLKDTLKPLIKENITNELVKV
ncbi:nucleotidyltransferase family protein [Stygiobacter electus]|uniref:Nucleotidyltransferase family protein n=1 Tax=Stygiobacter electus TaxID=3032292 RepID=A0AAE3TDP2_9BACT|nr:nucleotidyltransferase family protein [Stygiobacter electus]MDF1611612.1 nucleotidyltransferase family protein [Stygiobacter electus]